MKSDFFFLFFQRYNQKAKEDKTCASCLIKSKKRSFCSRCKRKQQTQLTTQEDDGAWGIRKYTPATSHDLLWTPHQQPFILNHSSIMNFTYYYLIFLCDINPDSMFLLFEHFGYPTWLLKDPFHISKFQSTHPSIKRVSANPKKSLRPLKVVWFWWKRTYTKLLWTAQL